MYFNQVETTEGASLVNMSFVTKIEVRGDVVRYWVQGSSTPVDECFGTHEMAARAFARIKEVLAFKEYLRREL